MKKQEWTKKLTAFDAALCAMVETLTGRDCVVKNGGKYHYFLVVDYSLRDDPEYISAVMNAIAGRVGRKRFISFHDNPETKTFFAYIRFYVGDCKDTAFIPKLDKDYRQ